MTAEVYAKSLSLIVVNKFSLVTTELCRQPVCVCGVCVLRVCYCKPSVSLLKVSKSPLPASRYWNKPLLWVSAFTAGDFQSTHHHSFIDSSRSPSFPSSLIHKSRTAILIVLRTAEVFNGLLWDQSSSLQRVSLSFCRTSSWESLQWQVSITEPDRYLT